MVNHKGGKHKHLKKYGGQAKRELLIKDETMEYAQVDKLLGSSSIKCRLMNGTFLTAKIRGAMQKKVWINKNDIVLIQRFDQFTNDEDKGIIVHVYFSDEVKTLQKKGELPMDLEVSEKINNEKQDLQITFNREEPEEEEEEEQDKIKGKYKLQDLMPSDSESSDELADI